jgi:2-polyprenyl-6-methoxyphenol hydroxylase-like FAD-dependent oxidoreductase
VPDGPLAAEIAIPTGSAEDLPRIRATMLTAMDKWFPVSLGRINTATFNFTHVDDVLRGTVTPTVRRPYAQLSNGRWVLACGDVHTVHDPLMGQGANAASRSAFIVGDAILEDSLDFDEMWCTRVAERMWRSAEVSVEFTNEMLVSPPSPQVLATLLAAVHSQPWADYIGENFGWPDRQWNILASPTRALAGITRYAGPETAEAMRQLITTPAP